MQTSYLSWRLFFFFFYSSKRSFYPNNRTPVSKSYEEAHPASAEPASPAQRHPATAITQSSDTHRRLISTCCDFASVGWISFIVEAITNLKELRGSDRAAIALYIEMMEFHVARVSNVHWVHHCTGAAPSSAKMSITVNMARLVNVGNGRLICELCLLFLGSFC
ncbi:uncharacterized protein LOC108987355 [Juglans regia]|uniref:Uncharacterized protein LOC108987355 n=1 Tax=Juglans regia TaxID=51240 RepID=A0A2I4E8T2_JUGRE|nr:uncharacterized protein LOC108987355 [Juglans regia]